MTYSDFSLPGSERRPFRLFQAVSEFISAWVETSAAYVAYSEMSKLSNAKLAARGMRREDISRRAMNLPELLRE